MKQPISILTRRNFAVGTAALSALGLLAPAPSAYAQGKYPTRSPRLVLPFAAGGVADVTARIVAEKLGDVLGHRFIVDNQPGAGGINAANTVRSARPDGYALALLSNGTAVSVGLFNNVRSREGFYADLVDGLFRFPVLRERKLVVSEHGRFRQDGTRKAGDAQYRHNQHRQQPESYC
jgi:hypothetical protein